MPGTFWLNIEGNAPVYSDLLLGVAIEDREGLFKSAFSQDDCPDMTSLSIFGLSDLNLPHGSETPEIYKAAQRHQARKPSAGAALRVLTQHPSIFRSTIIDNKPMVGCLIGIEPIVAPSGKKYVLELGELDGQVYLRFRRADDDIRWPDYEYWVFAT
jgi:hypothetical protein